MLERRLVLLTLGLTFILLLAGGLVHSTGSALACPDWPLCFGQFFPKMTGGVEFEHSHRLIAGSVAILTLTLMIIIWRRHHKANLRVLSRTACLLVLVQALLGGLTVIYKLPTLVSTAHLATSMLFFSTLIALALTIFASAYEIDEHVLPLRSIGALAALRKLRPWLFGSVALVYAQIVLGGFVRHTGAGGACTTIPFCEDSLWPMDAHPAIRLHMAHRWGAILTALVVFYFSARVSYIASRLEQTRLGKHLRFFATTSALLITVQIALGLASVWTNLAIPFVTAHLGAGALLLASTLAIWRLAIFACGSAAQEVEMVKPRVPSARLQLAQDILSLTKARLSLLVMLVTAIPFFIAAESFPPPRLVFSTLVGTFMLIAGGAMLNAYLEKDTDLQMSRTHDRPLPQNRFSPTIVLYLGVLLGFIGVPLLTFAVNPLTGFLGALAYVSYVFLYTPLKTKTSLAFLVGAIPGALPPLIGWTAAMDQIDWIGVTLFFILFFWQLPHFFAIAIYRKEEYQRAGIRVMPLAEGEALTRRLMIRYSALLIPITLFLVPLGVAGKAYFITALLLGLTYLVWSCLGLRQSFGARWARGLFIYSLVYLPLLFFSLILDAKF